ncbi:unnamed protein product [Prorocentrum cordatum]|uniref:PARP-type domain-containing protein n=1 Tax=Prorocentrum cordatum TaxID=2364126 RepID=A0ABN9TYJ2_9DINO|nr:unnamed protein product [Polarella glacialis]
MPAILSKCDKCGRDIQEGERHIQVYKATQARGAVYRHSECNNFQSRCQAVLRQNEKLRARWAAQGPAARQEFFQQHGALYGEELAVTLCESLEIESEKLSKQGVKGEGQWLDETTIRDTFKNRPQQAEAILRNADTFYHETREVTLYQVFEYVSVQEDMETDREVRKRKTESEVTQRPKAKAKGKAKVTAKAAAEATGEPADKGKKPQAPAQEPLSETDKKKLEALVAKTDAALLSIAGALVTAGAPEMAGAVPAMLLKVVETSRDTLTVKKRELDGALQAGTAVKGFVTQTAKEMKETFQVATDVVGRVNDSAEFAQAFLEAPAPSTAATTVAGEPVEATAVDPLD